MAENESSHMFCSSNFCKKLLSDVQNCLQTRNIAHTKTCVIKRVRDLHDGDYCVPQGCLPKVDTEVLEEICAELKDSSENGRFLHDVKSTKQYSIAFFLQRPLALKASLVPLWENKVADLAFSETGNGAEVLVCLSDWCGSDTGDLDVLRSVVLTDHVTHLLRNAGYCVEAVKCCQHVKPLPDILRIPIQDRVVTPEITQNCRHLLTNLSDNPYYEESRQTVKESGDDTPRKHARLEEGGSEVCVDGSKQQSLNVHKFVEDKQLPVGREGYDKNLKYSEITCTEDVVPKTLQHAYLLHEAVGKFQKPSTVIHVVPDTGYFSQQRVDLTTRILWPGDDTHKQAYLVHGPVKSRRHSPASNKTMSAADFIQLRFKQMKTAAVMKFGDQVNGPGWQDTISVLTSTAIKFEMLSTVSRSMVKLDLSDAESGQDNRTGAFVMYNCARLSTLFKHFEESVSKGYYPPLPKISDVDFSLLREEDEWSLFFHYVFPYPDLLRETVEELVPKAASIVTKMHTHKICNFLINFSHSLSSYYSRTHVLGENRSHLLPVMFSRLYFLKVVYKILCHALSLLGIDPLSQL